MKTLMLTTAAALSMATIATAQDVKFADIDVTVELRDVENANALDYWPTIEADMEKVMTDRVASMYAPDGLDIDVSVTEVSLSGSTLLKEQGEFNTLQGWVYVRDENNGNLVDNFKINLRAETGQVGLQDGQIKLPEMQAFYDALLGAFADKTVERVLEEAN
ncbi:MAG: hypothetical protein HKN27_16655 [Silicimonas sp.]|nr:hypothetical protein [Silicimonas sp.]